MEKEEITALFGKFESISCEVEGIGCWNARELQPLLGYAKQDSSIDDVAMKAKGACRNTGESVQNRFPDAGKMASTSYGIEKQIDDVLLTRYACYLVAQNSDSCKPQVAFAQTYFAVRTRKAEIVEQRPLDCERLRAREKSSQTERQLSGISYERGIDDKRLAIIRSKGDQALFNLSTQTLKKRINILTSRPIADFLPTISIKAKDLATKVANVSVRAKDLYEQSPIGKKHAGSNTAVRDMLLRRGIKPEQLSPNENIKKVQRRMNKDGKRSLKNK